MKIVIHAIRQLATETVFKEEFEEFWARLSGGAKPMMFERAKPEQKRLKIFLYGDTGTGKTVFGLQFPSPVVLDLERGTDHYAKLYAFDRKQTTSADDVIAAVNWLATNRHEYKTLIIDPFTVFWESLQRKWSNIFLNRNKGKKGYKFEFYDLDWKDWGTVKAELKDTLRKLLALDMHVIVTARQKLIYPENGAKGDVVETFDGEKSLPYAFDIVLQLKRTPDNQYIAKAIKDRTGIFPKEDFPSAYSYINKCLDSGELERTAEPIRMVSTERLTYLSKLLKKSAIPEEVLQERLQSYGAEDITDLTEANAELIIAKLEAKNGGASHAED